LTSPLNAIREHRYFCGDRLTNVKSIDALPNGLLHPKFLEVGNALSELRNRRLYRTEFATFEQYVLAKFALHRSSVDGVIRSAQTAQVLLDAGLQLPPDTNPTSLRAISALPTDELKTVCWELARSLSPARAPSQPLVSRLCRLVRNCLDSEQDDASETSESRHVPDAYHGRRRVSSPQREVPFIRPITRLVNFPGFHPLVIVADIDEVSRAMTAYSVCQKMISRCEQVQSVLLERFPELVTVFPEIANPYVEHHQS
jgi:hypothetical protein